jgi:hypothetical protein
LRGATLRLRVSCLRRFIAPRRVVFVQRSA